MRVERIKDGVLATERGVCFKSPCPEKLLLFSGRRRVGLSPEDCRKRMYLAQAWAPLFCTAGQSPFVNEGDCSSNRAEAT